MKQSRFIGSIVCLFAMLKMVASTFVVEGVTYSCGGSSAIIKAISTEWVDASNGVLEFPASVVYDNKSYQVTQLGFGAISEFDNLREVILPASINTIDGRNFYDCPLLTKVMLNNGLRDIKESCFYKLPSLVTIVLPATLKSIGMQCFCELNSLRELSLPKGCEFLSGCFQSLPLLDKVVLPSDMLHLSADSFVNLPSLKELNLNGITEIYTMAIRDNNGLEDLVFDENCTLISNDVATGCTNLKSITLPSNPDCVIFDDCFTGCPKLEAIYARSYTPQLICHFSGLELDGEQEAADSEYLMSSHIGGGGKNKLNLKTCVLYVPKGTLDYYKANSSWNGFAHIREYDFNGIEQAVAYAPFKLDDHIVSSENGIIITGLPRCEIRISRIDGTTVLLIPSAKATEKISLKEGTYIVTVDGNGFKVVL